MTEKKLLSTHEFQLRWVDLDVYNHLNNAKYYDFMTESRASALIDFMHDCNFIVVENSCKYKQSIQYPGNVVVEQYVKNVTNISFECIYLLKSGAEQNTHAEGYAKIVCFDKHKNKPCKIPEKLRILIS